jgi:hypothetical protein
MKQLKKVSILLFSFLLFYSCDETTETESQHEVLNFIGETESFGDFSVYKLLNNENLNIALRISGAGRDSLDLTSGVNTFSLPNNDLIIEISEWDRSVLGYFSDDAIVFGEEPIKLKTWSSISGTIKLSVSNIEILTTPPNFTIYDITIHLENVIFENKEGEQKSIENLNIQNAKVGWLPG